MRGEGAFMYVRVSVYSRVIVLVRRIFTCKCSVCVAAAATTRGRVLRVNLAIIASTMLRVNLTQHRRGIGLADQILYPGGA